MFSGDAERARVWDGNPLSGDPEPAWDAADWIVSPGWLPAEDGEPVSPADDRVSFRTFAAAGREAFDSACARLGASQRLVIFRPTASSVLSDIPSIRAVSKSWPAGSQFRLLLDPVALLTPSMVGAADEHLRRMAEDLVSLDRVWAVRITDAAVVEGRVEPRAVGAGDLPGEALAGVAAAARAAGAPIVVLGSGSIDEQVRALGLA